MSHAIYAFSGDPITHGHIDIIKRASKIFDHLTIAIGNNRKKEYLFSLEERTNLAKKSLEKFTNVTVTSFRGLLVDYAYENNIGIIIKGMRSYKDFNYEKNLHLAGESQKLNIETVIFFTKPELAHVSSSMVKMIQRDHGLTHEYVPFVVKQALERKISNQTIIGVTGEIGCGKTYLCEQLTAHANKKNIEIHNVDLDIIAHRILDELTEPKYLQIRNTIIEEFGSGITSKDGKIDRKKLGEIVFNDKSKLTKLNDIMSTPIMVRFGRALANKKGIILLNAALLVETNISHLSNNNMIVVNCNKESQMSRLKDRDLSQDQIKRRLENQYSAEEKINSLKETIKNDNWGKIWQINSSSNKENYQADVDKILTEIANLFSTI